MIELDDYYVILWRINADEKFRILGLDIFTNIDKANYQLKQIRSLSAEFQIAKLSAMSTNVLNTVEDRDQRILTL